MADVYESLRERLDMFPQGFPKTQSGVELEVLRELFTPEEAEIMHYLRPYPEPVSASAERMNRDEAEMADKLYKMSRKGLILRATIEGVTYYLMAPYIVGIWEFQLKNLNKDNIKLYERYHQEGMVPERKKAKTAGFRVIPIEKEIQDSSEIQTFEKVSEIIEASTRFGVSECICRKEAQIMGHGCDKLLEACMSFGLAADYCIENGLAREITKEEAIDILRKTEESGLVHCSSNHKGGKNFICNCCGCCCKALQYLNKHDVPWAVSQSNYYAVVDEQTCSACETCLDRCQVKAIQMVDDVAVIKTETCIGCGLCVSTCPTESISMVLKEPEQRPIIFEDQMKLLQTLGAEKNKVYPFE